MGDEWDHEKFGGEIIKYLIDENQIEGINEDMLKMINSLIEGLIYIILNIIGFIKL